MYEDPVDTILVKSGQTARALCRQIQSDAVEISDELEEMLEYAPESREQVILCLRVASLLKKELKTLKETIDEEQFASYEEIAGSLGISTGFVREIMPDGRLQVPIRAKG